VTTTNQIYGCKELEEAGSIYDEIQDSHYDELKEQAVYLDILPDETEECVHSSKAELPSRQDQLLNQATTKD